jgi:hypothetical protein
MREMKSNIKNGLRREEKTAKIRLLNYLPKQIVNKEK